LGVIGFMVLMLFVNGRPEAKEAAKPARQAPVTMADAARLMRKPEFRRLVIIGGFLGLVTISDAFLYLGLQRRIEFNTALFPLLYVGTAVSFMILAIPVGRLADRYGRLRVFVVGYVLLLISYLALLPHTVTPLALVACLAIFGAYYACTDGVLMAAATGMLPEDLRASGMGILVTSTSLGRLGGSILFGALWTVIGMTNAAIVFGCGLAVMILVAAVAMRSATPAPENV
jgi:MFS family permease